MKRIQALIGMWALLCLVILQSCEQESEPIYIRVRTFTWDGAVYRAQYDGLGKLIKLNATKRSITFDYDESGKLYKATTRNLSEITPLIVYEYTHGPFGIQEIHTFERQDGGDGLLHITSIQKANYSDATHLSSLLQQEVSDDGGSEVVTFELDRKFTYTGDNVSRIYVEPPFNEYTASKYDGKVNPFMMLAASVGNPAFFPIGRFVNYPVVDFNIPLVSAFSFNNPLKAKYTIPAAPIVSEQTFANTYSDGLVKKIVWKSTGSPNESRTFAFDYERAKAPSGYAKQDKVRRMK